MDYIIDGYNFMFRIQDQKRKESFEKARETLIALLNEELRAIKTHASVVFDSSEAVREYAQSAFLKNIEVVYAPKGLTADEYIIELVEQSKSPKTLTVVTSDSGLARQCQHLGAKTISIEDFVALIARRNEQKPLSKPHYKEHPQQLERLRKIFEDKLGKDGS